MSYVNKITVDKAGVQYLMVDTDKPLVKDENDTVIPYTIVFSEPLAKISFILVYFPQAGTYYVYEDTPQEDTSVFQKVTVSDQNTAVGDYSIKKNYRLVPLGYRLIKNPYWDTSEHIQGTAYYNGKLYFAVTKSIGVLDLHTMTVQKLLDIEDIRSREEQNHIDDIDIDENGYMYVPIMYWTSSGYGYGEIVVIDTKTLQVVKRCYLGDDAEASSLKIVGDYIYLAQYDLGKIIKLNKADCSIIGDFAAVEKVNGIEYLPEYDSLLVVTNTGDTFPTYLVKLSDGSLEGPITYLRCDSAGIGRLGNLIIVGERFYPGGPDHISFYYVADTSEALAFGNTSSDGSNKIIDAGLSFDNKTYIALISNSHCAETLVNSNKAPGIAFASSDLKSGIIIEQSHGAIGVVEYDIDAGTNNIIDQEDIPGVWNDSNNTDGCRSGHGVLLAKYDGSQFKYSFIAPNEVQASKTTSYNGSFEKIGLRIWRLTTLFGPLYVSTVDPDPATVSSIEYNPPTPTTTTTTATSRQGFSMWWLLLALVGLLLLKRKR